MAIRDDVSDCKQRATGSCCRAGPLRGERPGVGGVEGTRVSMTSRLPNSRNSLTEAVVILTKTVANNGQPGQEGHFDHRSCISVGLGRRSIVRIVFLILPPPSDSPRPPLFQRSAPDRPHCFSQQSRFRGRTGGMALYNRADC